MSQSYPLDLPFFTARDGWSQSAPDAMLRTEMSAGPAKQRRRFTAAPRRMPGRIAYLTADDLAVFEDFYATDLQMGALSFTATHPVTQVEEVFRFTGGYTVEPRGVGFTVTATLEILP